MNARRTISGLAFAAFDSRFLPVVKISLPNFDLPPRLHLHGFSPWDTDRLWQALRTGQPPSALPGDFVLIAEGHTDGMPATVMASSVVSALPYFYWVSSDRQSLAHAATVFQVWRQAGIAWQWNDRALQCLPLLQHTLGDDSLHADIKRMPPAAVVVHRPGSLEIVVEPFWETLFDHAPRTDPEAAAASFERTLAATIGQEPVALSLSAGYDSRVLLAGALHLGTKPILGTMGRVQDTDRRIATRLAREFGLEHRIVELDPRQYLEEAARIVEITSGTKPANHWHTHLFIRQVQFPAGCAHLAGSNGEFVRTYFFDKGLAALVADTLPHSLSALFWRYKYSPDRRLRLATLDRLRETQHAWAFANIPPLIDASEPTAAGFLDRLDLFYACHRVRHFIGNGLALYHATVPTRSPFLDASFVRMGAGLPRRWKLSSRFHRHLIARFCPRLLDFPTDDTATSMAQHDRPLYWLRARPTCDFNIFGEVLELPETKALLLESPHLDQFVPRPQREEAYTRRQQPLLGVLLTLHFAAEKIAAAGAGARS